MSVHNLYVWMQWILDYIYSVPLSVRISCQQNKYNSIRFPHVEIVHSVQEGLPLCIQDMKMDELFSKLIYFTFPASLTAHHSVNLLLNDIIVMKELVEFICIFIFSIHSSDICSGYSMKNSDALWRMESISVTCRGNFVAALLLPFVCSLNVMICQSRQMTNWSWIDIVKEH